MPAAIKGPDTKGPAIKEPATKGKGFREFTLGPAALRYHRAQTPLSMIQIQRPPQKNVLGGPLQMCSTEPMTGFFRDGCCRTDEQDEGSHTVCCRVTADFLQFSALKGNDLSTPWPEYGFFGLQPGDQWCLCAARWNEAHEAGMAPPVVLEATHERALDICRLEDLKAFALPG